jgi:Glycosyltransferases, probably involved in cell wall biogenesis
MSGHVVRPGTALVATVFAEEESLPAFLDALEAQTLHPSEIVVVDGGSPDRTAALLSAWAPACGCRIIVHVADGVGISEGRNIAIAGADADHIVVTDAGALARPDWFARLTSPWDDDPTAVIAGFFEPTGRTFWERTIAAIITPTAAEIDGETFLPSSRSVAFPREAWRVVGGYPEWLDYCEDLVFDLALRDHAGPFVFVPDAVVAWVGRPGLVSFGRQYYRYARGDGKAGLFARRHLVRYGAYAFAAASWRLSPWAVGAGAVAFVGYMIKPWRRLWARRSTFRGAELPAALGVAPFVVVVGDVAKMIGYLPGVRWRGSRR